MPYCQHCGVESSNIKQPCPSCGKEMTLGTDVDGNNTSRKTVSLAGHFATVPACSKGARIFAGIIDAAIAGALLYALRRYQLLPPLLSKYQFLLSIVPALYLVLRDSLGGKSVGKLIAGITVVNIAENKIGGIGDSFLRNGLLVFVAIPRYGWMAGLAVGSIMFLQVLFGKGSRLGDKFANTRVVNDRSLGEAL